MKIAIVILKQAFVSGYTAFACICDDSQVSTQIKNLTDSDLAYRISLLAVEDDVKDCDFSPAWVSDKSIEFDSQNVTAYKFLTKIN